MVIFFGNLISRTFINKTSYKIISVKFNRENLEVKDQIINSLSEFYLTVDSKSFIMK